VVQRRRLGPPVSSWVYELTEWGHDLEPVLAHLGRWGRRSPFRDVEAEVSADSVLLALRSHFAPEDAVGLEMTCALHLGEDHFSIRISAGNLEIVRGDPPTPGVVIETDSRTFVALLAKRQSLDETISSGRLTWTGEIELIKRLLALLPDA